MYLQNILVPQRRSRCCIVCSTYVSSGICMLILRHNFQQYTQKSRPGFFPSQPRFLMWYSNCIIYPESERTYENIVYFFLCDCDYEKWREKKTLWVQISNFSAAVTSCFLDPFLLQSSFRRGFAYSAFILNLYVELVGYFHSSYQNSCLDV